MQLSNKPKILFLDDEVDILETLRDNFEEEFLVYTASNLYDAKEILKKINPPVVVVDKKMPDIDGIDFLAYDAKVSPHRIRILLTAYSDRDTILNAINKGHVWSFFEKPISPIKIKRWIYEIKNALELFNLREEVKFLRKVISENDTFEYANNRLKQMKFICEKVLKVSSYSDVDLLIEGETGTGKTLIAKAIHFNSPRRNNPFKTIFIPNIPKDLLEAELFGYKGGAFTGSSKTDKIGLIESADGGTIFLDEISEMPYETQGKFLRFIQDKEFEMVGSTNLKRADVRIVAATNKDLQKEVELGRLRSDLFFRLGYKIKIPPLKERKEEIEELANHLLEKHNHINKMVKGIEESAKKYMLEYSWPGNIREMEKRIRDGLINTENEFLQINDIFPELELKLPQYNNVSNESLKVLKEKAEKEIILKRLSLYNGNKTKTAKSLGITYEALYKIIKKWDK